MTFPLTGTALIELIPQKPPFVLIDALLGISETSCQTSFTIPADHVLCAHGKMSASGLIENIAQTCAAKAGFEYKQIGKEIPVGFIGDVRHFECKKRPAAGSIIFTTIEIEHHVFGATIISGKVMMNSEIIASCKMKIFVNEPATVEQNHATQHA